MIAIRRLMILALFLLAGNAPGGTLEQGVPGVQRLGQVLDASRLGKEPVSLTEHFSILEDPGGTLTLADVRRPELAARFMSGRAPAKTLNLGVSPSAFWLRLHLRNPGDQPIERMLELTVARLAASVEFHAPLYSSMGDQGYQTAHTGYLSPFSERPYKHHFYVFPLLIPAHADHVVYLRLQSPVALNVPARLWERSAFHRYERADYVSQAVYYGMVLAMVAFNLLLFIVLRDANYLLYVAFVTCTALAIGANNGITIEFLLGEFPRLANASTMVGTSITLTALLLFMRRMIGTRLLVPRLDALLKILIGVHLLLPFGLAASFPHFLRPALAADGGTALVILIIGLVCAFKRQRSAIFFVAAFALLCLAGIASSLGGLGILPANAFTNNGIQFGSAIEMVVLAFALADRYNVLRSEKAIAQREALQAQTDALQAEQRVVETLRTSERLLEGRVDERTAELSATITRLKQTQSELVHADKLASLGALVAGVAHELNTPIGNALITASGLEDSAKEFQEVMASGEMRKSTLTYFVQNAVPMAELIARSCQRAAGLIASFKQVAVDQTSEQRRAFDLRSLVEDNIAALRPSFRQAPWLIEVDIPAGIRCDSYPGPLGQVIANLVQNAVAHAFGGRDAGTLSVSATLKGGDVEMIFTDDGKGMTPAVLAHIFEPFYTTRLGHGGSGLGLSISLNIVTGVLGGTLHAVSAPGSGSRFEARFPLLAPSRAKAGETV